ncbi:MAG: valine--tRNA ligase [Enterobacteriaceae bacterium]
MKKYNPKKIELEILKIWNNFKLKINFKKKNKYSILMPPPNITGALHLGHAFQQTLIDILTRYNYMHGKSVLLRTGTDHAGIAAQFLIEKKLSKKNKNKDFYGKKKFIKLMHKWSFKISKIISNQTKRLGILSENYKNIFTLDKNMSNAVNEAFICLYENGLIYKGKKLINWDVKLKTVISDLEVKTKIVRKKLWYIKYKLVNYDLNLYKHKYIVICTSRPETIIADTAIAVNPKDERYKNLIGMKVIIPIINRKIPIISNDSVDINKGTGCLKVTPAHDFTDYKISQDNKLDIINVFDKEGKIKNFYEIIKYNKKIYKKNFILKTPKFLIGLTYKKARIALINKIEKIGLLKKIETRDSSIPYSDRSKSIVEPILTDQWYLNTKLLSKYSTYLVKKKLIKFIPDSYRNIYLKWMKNIQDWCISRQLWWGHRIPIWYDRHNNKYVGKNENEVRKKFKIKKNIKLFQDKNVLDTWFSSSLWPFASLGWPKNNKYLEHFYPNDVIISGFDIIFFWISRMIMLSNYIAKCKKLNNRIPFKNVYITGLIRDVNNKKMSKSNNNVINPTDIINGTSLQNLLKENKNINYIKKKYSKGIETYGADSLRMSLSSIPNNKNINWSIDKLKTFSNFCNKLWNSCNFIIKNISKNIYLKNKKNVNLSYKINQWILFEFNKTLIKIKKFIYLYRFDLLVKYIYSFLWDEFCSWYLEFFKIKIKYSSPNEKKEMFNTFIFIFKSYIKVLHPVTPFITEKIWFILNKKNKKTILLQKFPKILCNLNVNYFIAYDDFSCIKNLIISIRKIKTKNTKIKKISICFNKKKNISFIKKNIFLIKKITKIENINFYVKKININKKDFIIYF